MPEYRPIAKLKGPDGLGVQKVGTEFYVTDEQPTIPDVDVEVVAQLSATSSPIKTAIQALINATAAGNVKSVDSTKKLEVIGGCLRNETNAWQPLENSAHGTLGVASVTTSTTGITLNFSKTFSKIISFVAVPDETLATAGVHIGSSVGTGLAEIRLGGGVGVDGYVSYNGTSWVVDGPAGVTAAWDNANGCVVVSYPTLPVASTVTGTELTLTPRSGTRCSLSNDVSYGGGSFGVDFYAADGTKFTSPGTTMRFRFGHHATGLLNAQQVNTTYLPNSNIWWLAIMETA